MGECLGGECPSAQPGSPSCPCLEGWVKGGEPGGVSSPHHPLLPGGKGESPPAVINSHPPGKNTMLQAINGVCVKSVPVCLGERYKSVGSGPVSQAWEGGSSVSLPGREGGSPWVPQSRSQTTTVPARGRYKKKVWGGNCGGKGAGVRAITWEGTVQ